MRIQFISAKKNLQYLYYLKVDIVENMKISILILRRERIYIYIYIYIYISKHEEC